jgi:histidine triad (HIT) family protein
MEESENELLLEMMTVIRKVATKVETDYGSCKIITNLGEYQDSKHLHWHIISGAIVK